MILETLAALALAASPPTRQPAHVGYPTSIAAIGDSLTTGYDSQVPARDTVSNSWATGTNPAVQSQYLRILAHAPGIRGHAVDLAEDGQGIMTSFLKQVGYAVTEKSQYVVIEIGGNDVCGNGLPSVPTAAQIGATFARGLATLSRGLPDARIMVYSVTDVKPVDALLGTVPAGRTSLSDGSACDPHYDAAGTPDPARAAALTQVEQAYNAALARDCAAYVHCRFDGGALFGVFQGFTLADYSSLGPTPYDGHPSISGLAKLAAATWSATFDFGDTKAPVSKSTRSGRTVTLSATDNVGVSGIEYRLGTKPYVRYTRPVQVPKGVTLTWRAVDVDGDCEATHSLRG